MVGTDSLDSLDSFGVSDQSTDRSEKDVLKMFAATMSIWPVLQAQELFVSIKFE